MSAEQGQLVKIGTVAAQNICIALELDRAQAPAIERAIADEINAMSAHFTLAFADIQTQYEAETLKLKSTHRFVSENVWQVLSVSLGLMVLGAVVGYYFR